MSHSRSAPPGEMTREQRIFEQYSVPKAVAAMVLPAIISQIVNVVYNLADTWFVGLTGDPAAVAAISLCMPVYNILVAISNMFGMGGSSVIARALGIGDREKAKRSFAVAFWGALLAGLAYSLFFLLCKRPLLLRIGGDASDIDYAVVYALLTIVIGGVPAVLSGCFAHLIRATGESSRASFGMSLGAILNFALDPLFMFVLLPKGHEVLGTAIATALANTISLLYFVVFLRRKKQQHPIYTVRPGLLSGAGEQLRDIVRCGLPSFCLIGLATVSNCFLNAIIGGMGSAAAMAGIGVVRKIDSLAFSVNQGVTQGMLPLVAYCYASGRHRRMKSAIALCAVSTILFSLLCAIVSRSFAPTLISLFIRDDQTIYYGAYFLRRLCLAIPIYSGTFVIIAAFQAMGQSWQPFLLTLLHKGSVDIFLIHLFARKFGPINVVWVAPLMETVALVVALIFLYRFLRVLKRRPAPPKTT